LGEPGGSPQASPHLPNAEPADPFRLFSRDFDRIDSSAARAAVGERDESFHGVVLPFEDGFYRPVEPVRHPSGNVMLLCEPPHRVAEEHALNLAVNDDAAPDHRAYSRAIDGREVDWPIPYWHFDAGAAAMLILLAAIDEGYAAGVFGVFVEAMEPFKSLLAIPNDVDVACCITIGEPADDSNWSATRVG
jgi:hypothetical protein